jgi:hypothetical protein
MIKEPRNEEQAREWAKTLTKSKYECPKHGIFEVNKPPNYNGYPCRKCTQKGRLIKK